MKAKALLLVLVVLAVCTACAGAVAAPELTPTPVPLPMSVGTPDPAWSAVCAELEENLAVCLLAQDKIKTTLLTGPVVKVKLSWVTLADGIRAHTVEVEEVRKAQVGYEIFVLESGKDLSRFDRVFIYVKVGDREWEFGFPVEKCQPQ